MVEPLREVMSITTESDVGMARIRAHRLAEKEGFTEVEAAAVATAVSELARNVLVHAGRGEVQLCVAEEAERRGIVVVVRDDGPGIADTERAMQDGYSTTGTMGLGLPSARRLVDEWHIESAPGDGTTITATKWRNR